MSAQRIVQFNLSISGNQTVADAFTAALNSALSSAGYDITGSPTTYTRNYSLSTTFETMSSDFTTIVTANYPSGQSLSVYVYIYDYTAGYNY
jgi:hypothetical protein